MKQKRHSVDQIVSKLRKADVELGKGKKVPEVCKELEVTEQTYYRWRQKYGGMQPVMVKQLKSLEKENSRLKKLVADHLGVNTKALVGKIVKVKVLEIDMPRKRISVTRKL